jgi:hypothetical protein
MMSYTCRIRGGALQRWTRALARAPRIPPASPLIRGATAQDVLIHGQSGESEDTGDVARGDTSDSPTASAELFELFATRALRGASEGWAQGHARRDRGACLGRPAAATNRGSYMLDVKAQGVEIRGVRLRSSDWLHARYGI